MDKQRTVWWAALALAAAAALGAEVGLYDPATDGGKTAGGEAIRKTLREAGLEVASLPRLALADLLRHRVVILPNTRTVGRGEDPRWRDILRAYVAECGGALVFCHDAVGAARSPFGAVPLFPELVVPGTVERAAASEVRVAVDPADAEHPFLPDYPAGQLAPHMYDDHFRFEAAGGRMLLADPETGRAVVMVGAVGAGRVVCNGLFGGTPGGLAARLEGLDRAVLLGTVSWCLAGKGLAITNAAQAVVAPWRPPPPERHPARSKVAVIGMPDYDIAHRARTKISEAGLVNEFIPFHLLGLRELTPSDYALLVVFLPMAWEEPQVPDATFENIRRALDGGVKGLVFLPGGIGKKTERYFLAPAGMTPGKAVRDNPGELRAVAFADDAGQPARFRDIPGNWFADLSPPTAPGAALVGSWVDQAGKTGTPAVIRVPFGYLLNVNPAGQEHRRFVAPAVAALVPELGAPVFRELLATCDGEQREVAAAALAPPGRARLAQAEAGRRAAEDAARAGAFPKAVRLLLEAEADLERAYAVSMPSPTNELRMVCVHIREQPDPDLTCARLKQAGFNVVTLMHHEGQYPSPLYKRKDPADTTDWLQRWIETAHRHGLRVGPTFPAFMLYEGAPIYERAVAEDWRVVPAGLVGKTRPPLARAARLDDLCRSHPELVDYAIAKSREVVEKYPVDFIGYDYIRWAETCYCDTCRDRFQKDTGLKVEAWPDDAMGKYQQAFNDWRAAPVTRVIRESAAHIARVRPTVRLGVYTFRTRRESYAKGQHWWTWTDAADYVMPMFYGPDNAGLEALFREVNGLLPAGGKARLVACLAPPGARGGSNLVRLRQLDLQRAYAPTGVIYFWYHGLSDEFMDRLALGPFRDR